MPFGTVFVPSICSSRAGTVGAMTSTMPFARASRAPKFAASRTIASAASAFRPCSRASSAMYAAASLITFLRRSLPRCPRPWPRSASRSRCSSAAPSREHRRPGRSLRPRSLRSSPVGRDVDDDRHLQASIVFTISRIEEPSPPGVSISITTARAPHARRGHLALEVVLRDRVDVVVELDDENTRRVGRRRGGRREGQRQEQPGGTRREEAPERSHEARVHVDSTVATGRRGPVGRRGRVSIPSREGHGPCRRSGAASPWCSPHDPSARPDRSARAGATHVRLGRARDAPGARALARRRPLARVDAGEFAVPARRHPLAGGGQARAADTRPGRLRGRRGSRSARRTATRPTRPVPRREPCAAGGRVRPVWVGRAVGLEVRAVGRVTRARALTVRSPVSKVPLRVTAAAGMPQIVPRSAWQADESIRKEKPVYADTLRMAFVHHTAGTNSYTRAQAPAVVRAIEIYHVKGNGWNDIGYNALVDRFGTVYEGRFGGIDRNVVGAHAKGFNTGSFGIAVMGDFRAVDPPPASVDALVRTLAWRLDLGHVDPLSTFNGISSGNERFGAGISVFLRAISGHRDTGLDDVPGPAPLRPDPDDRASRRRARPAEALRPVRRAGRVGRRPVHARGCPRACHGRSLSRTPRAPSSAAAKGRDPRSTGPGFRPGRSRPGRSGGSSRRGRRRLRACSPPRRRRCG